MWTPAGCSGDGARQHIWRQRHADPLILEDQSVAGIV
jgi:hypothetical protein